MTQSRHLFVALVTVAVVVGVARIAARQSLMQRPSDTTMHNLAERYVKLVLAMEPHDPDYVDAYYGPDAWREQADRDALALPQIGTAAQVLLDELEQTSPGNGADVAGDVDDSDAEASLPHLRRQYLSRQLQALQTRVRAEGTDDQTAIPEPPRLVFPGDPRGPRIAAAGGGPARRSIRTVPERVCRTASPPGPRV